MSGFNNLIFTTTSNGELNISSQNITGVPIVPVAPSTLGLISEYALLISPTFTGEPKAPTPDVSNNSTQIATTAYVRANRAELQANIDLKANINSPTLTGEPKTSLLDKTDDSNRIATTAHVHANRRDLQTNIDLKANINSPTLTGIPQVPTPDVSNNTTQIATTAYVRANRAELQTNIDLKANINSPTLTGIPRADTALASVHTTQLATTEYVYNAINDLIADAPVTLNTLREIADALVINDAEDARTLQLILTTISNTDASLNLKATKTLVDSSFALVDASFTQVYTSKADKSVVDASFSQVYTSKAVSYTHLTLPTIYSV